MNFAAFDLNLLRVFDALARERSVTRAGDQVGLSQPAVSSALNRLRALLDDQLFVRRGAEMAPTPRAEALAPAVREALASLALPGLYERLAQEAPGIRLRLVDTAFGDVERLLADDVLDLALERPLQLPEWVASELLFPSPFVLVAAKGQRQVEAAGIRPGEALPIDLYCALPHAIRTVDGSLTGLVDEALEAQGRRRNVVLGLPHFFAVARAVAGGRLIAALPSQFAEAFAEELGLAIYAPPIAVPAPEIRMYWHSRHNKNPAHAWLRERVLEVIKALS